MASPALKPVGTTYSKISKIVAASLTGVIAVWSFLYTCLTGHLGIFMLDQAMLFDAAWRIVCGQAPYKDYLMALGPMAPAIQAAFFKVFGVNWTAYVLSAAVLSAGAALSVRRTILLLFGEDRIWLALGCSLLVGTAFQAVFGTLWFEQVGFFFCLLAIQAICEAQGSRVPMVWLFLAGVSGVLSFLGKQNVGTLTLALTGVLVLLGSRWKLPEIMKSAVAFLAGVLFAGGLFAAWLVLFSDLHLFLRHAVQVPGQVGRGRLGLRALFPSYLLASIPLATQWCYAISLGAFTWTVTFIFTRPTFRRQLLDEPKLRLAIALSLAIPVLQSFFQAITFNEWQNTIFLSSLALCIGLGLVRVLSPAIEGRWWTRAFGAFVGVFILIESVHFAFNRSVQNAFPFHNHHISRTLAIPPLTHLRWIQPTTIGKAFQGDRRGEVDVELKPEAFEDLYAYLVSSKQDFYLIGDSTLMYGLTGVVPPQPLLYLQPNHYFLKEDIPVLDTKILDSLQRRNIRVIVREKVNYYNYFPFSKTENWINSNFHQGPLFGNYEIWLRER